MAITVSLKCCNLSQVTQKLASFILFSLVRKKKMIGSLSMKEVLVFSLLCNFLLFVLLYFTISRLSSLLHHQIESSTTPVTSRQILFVGGVPTTLTRCRMQVRSEFLCNKDPLVLNHMVVKVDVVGMFPQSNYVLLIKDGRTVAYSLVSRNVTVGTEM